MLFTPACTGRLYGDGIDDMAGDVAVLRGEGRGHVRCRYGASCKFYGFTIMKNSTTVRDHVQITRILHPLSLTIGSQVLSLPTLLEISISIVEQNHTRWDHRKLQKRTLPYVNERLETYLGCCPALM
jgi:hypothetical protein